MDKFSVESLFPSKTNAVDKIKRGELDIKTLFPTDNEKLKNKEKFSIDLIIAKKEKDRKLVKKIYKNQFNDCLNKIKIAHELNKIYLVYSVPLKKIDHINYNVLDCTDYIKKKLKKLHFDFYVFDSTYIYISWEHIEENKLEDEKN
jgi:hypothetical protein